MSRLNFDKALKEDEWRRSVSCILDKYQRNKEKEEKYEQMRLDDSRYKSIVHFVVKTLEEQNIEPTNKNIAEKVKDIISNYKCFSDRFSVDEMERIISAIRRKLTKNNYYSKYKSGSAKDER